MVEYSDHEVVKEVHVVEYREVVKEVPVVEYSDREVVKEVDKVEYCETWVFAAEERASAERKAAEVPMKKMTNSAEVPMKKTTNVYSERARESVVYWYSI